MLFANVATNVPPQTAYALVEKIGLRFNEALRKVSTSKLFAEYPANR